MTTRHRAPMDLPVLVVTLLCGVPVGAIAVTFGWRALAWPGHGMAWVVFGLTAGILVGTWITSPTAFRIEPGRLVVERPLGEIVYPLAGLAEVRPFQPSTLTMRVGNGGLFGITGWYWNRTLGWFTVHGRKVRGTVLLRWPDRTVVVMPEDAARFIADVERVAPKSGPV